MIPASALVELGDVASVQRAYGGSRRAAEQLLTLARRAVAEGLPGRLLEPPEPVRLAQGPPGPGPERDPEALARARVLASWKPAEPTVEERHYQQWEARLSDIEARNLKNGYGPSQLTAQTYAAAKAGERHDD